MENLNNWIIVTNDFIWTYILIALLICIGIYFTFKSRFVQFRNIREMFRLLGDGIASGNHKNSVSSFQAFCIATASRVGTGNLAGVATALALGGPGAIFWMWLIALIGSASAFIESTLAQIYKVKGDRSFIGGPAFYMEKGLKKRWLGILFAVIITITFGLVFNSVQANTVTLAFHEVFGTSRVWLGIILTCSPYWSYSVEFTGSPLYPGLSSPSWLSHTFYLPLSSCSRISEHYLMSLVLFLRTHSDSNNSQAGV